ncbi:hypothetical protein IZ6_08140 [Terrihabitans soli]|uniref:DUF3630 family protein n=1 Tax=Terrihabitans soli TaxID=708113 RepID=A0A6S6QMC1_9HYPH|nr:hypothetical protein [Terrihabitans soli]BCJ90079.1 hypothetical protein IZ6_08140 [Terrihabitans soli]
MAFRLHNLPDGLVSLEFEERDQEVLREAIGALYGPSDQQWVTGNVAEITFGGESFAYQAEWDEPCLVAGNPEAADLLKDLHAFLIR